MRDDAALLEAGRGVEKGVPLADERPERDGEDEEGANLSLSEHPLEKSGSSREVRGILHPRIGDDGDDDVDADEDIAADEKETGFSG